LITRETMGSRSIAPSSPKHWTKISSKVVNCPLEAWRLSQAMGWSVDDRSVVARVRDVPAVLCHLVSTLTNSWIVKSILREQGRQPLCTMLFPGRKYPYLPPAIECESKG
jgi:hypothetical protein